MHARQHGPRRADQQWRAADLSRRPELFFALVLFIAIAGIPLLITNSRELDITQDIGQDQEVMEGLHKRWHEHLLLTRSNR